MKPAVFYPFRPPTETRRGFDGLRVLALESRRAEDIYRLIAKSGGEQRLPDHVDSVLLVFVAHVFQNV